MLNAAHSVWGDDLIEIWYREAVGRNFYFAIIYRNIDERERQESAQKTKLQLPSRKAIKLLFDFRKPDFNTGLAF